MATKTIEITPEVRAVLERGAGAEAGTFHLPDGQLERKLYQAVDQVLGTMGGRWDRKARGHRFDADARQALENALADGRVLDRKRTFEQFFTPGALADRLVERAVRRLGRAVGISVLEPSAGDGALIRSIYVYTEPSRVVAIELDEELNSSLREIMAPCGEYTVMQQDFTTYRVLEPEAFDLIVMNPPFSKNQDIRHVGLALQHLAPGGVLAAIMSTHWTFAGDMDSRGFRKLVHELGGETIHNPQGSFKPAGTAVATCMVLFRKPG